IKRLKRGHQRGKKHSIILLAEGGGDGMEYAKKIKETTHFETRATVLGHLQRGGSPTASDRVLASRLGAEAVDLLMNKQDKKVIGLFQNELASKGMEEILSGEHHIDEKLYNLTSALSIYKEKRMNIMRKTKIVATIGPASESEETLTALMKNGMNVARLNFSHGDYEEHQVRIKRIRDVADRLNKTVGILLDTQGPEIRTMNFKDGEAYLERDSQVTITMEDIEG